MSKIINKSLLSHIKIISKQAKEVRHRRIVIVNTELDSFDSVLAQLFKEVVNDKSQTKQSLFYGASSLNSNVDYVNAIASNYLHHLGTENSLVVYCEEDFHPDAFCALSGTLVAGGCLVWIKSKQDISDNLWLSRIEYFCSKEKYLISHIEENGGQLKGITSHLLVNNPVRGVKPFIDTELNFLVPCKTKDQHNALRAIECHFKGKGQKYCVLTADRGRGKSSTLAMYCAKLMAEKSINIVISAPHIRSVAIFFNMLKNCHPEGRKNNHSFSLNDSSVEYRPIDVLIKDDKSIDLLVIDEAAGFPIYLLSQVTMYSRKVIFSSTVHGYEGAGRGFSLKFIKSLNTLKTPILEQRLDEPVRWATNDPLEQFTFDCFLLNAEIHNISKNQAAMANLSTTVTFAHYSAKDLSCDEPLLNQIYALLVTAHYQTSPSDLKLLLSNDAVQLIVSAFDDNVVGVALVIAEGGASSVEISAIKESKRQLKNQFIPQSILRHIGLEEAFNYRYLRVARIATHPELQGQGVGSLLLKHIVNDAKGKGFDFVGTSFGATSELAKFWYNNNFQTIRLGVNVDKASGENSVLMLHHLNENSSLFLKQLHSTFIESFGFMLSEQFKFIAPELVALIYRFSNSPLINGYSDYEKKSVGAFVSKQRQFHSCVYQLAKGLIFFLHHEEEINDKTNILIKRILQKHSEEKVIKEFNLTGKKELNKVIIDRYKKYST